MIYYFMLNVDVVTNSVCEGSQQNIILKMYYDIN